VLLVGILVGILTGIEGFARAEDDADRLFVLEGGGGLLVNHPALGIWGASEYWPAGSRWAARGELFGWQGPHLLLEAGVARLVGNSRPHLAISLHASLGAEVDDIAITGSAGFTVLLGIKGPFALALDATVRTVVWNDRLDLMIVNSLGFGLSF
jgi:hypothetical protein